MRIIVVFVVLFATQNLISQDFEIDIFKKSELILFVKKEVKVTVEGDSVPGIDALYADSGETSLKDYFSLSSILEEQESNIENVLDKFSVEKKSFKQKKKTLKNFPQYLKELKKILKSVEKKIKNEIKKRGKLGKVFDADDNSWDIKSIKYPEFRYDYIIEDQKKSLESLEKEVKEEQEEIDEKRRSKELQENFKKDILPKLEEILKEMKENIDDSLEDDEAIDKLEKLYENLEKFLATDLKTRLRDKTLYEGLQEKIKEELSEMRSFKSLVEDVIDSIDDLVGIATKESGFRLHPKDEEKFDSLKTGLKREVKDYKNMTKKTKGVNKFFTNDKAFKRLYKELKNKKEIKKFLKSIKKAKKEIAKIEIESLIKKLQKVIKSVSFIPREKRRHS
ncbi:hypothetical protein [Candidatus Uabimicrobium sp. HlEnr_7]|uniref:hypothetical protein n=1 Tax=Candidatus Uabimicrobium helgolandensis TaxID=3095367 RepID=UPI0035579BB8